MREGVVILHGILRARYSMAGLAKFLSQQRYNVLNLGYPSRRWPIEGIAAHLLPRINDFASQNDKLHYVGYSMGGLVIRSLLQQQRPENIGRVVMIGTPNSGSEVADYFQHHHWYRWLYGKAGQQLITRQSAFAAILANEGFECGIIAGDKPLDPVCARIIGQPNDGKVSVASTKLAGMKDHIILPIDHMRMPGHRPVWQQTLAFLRDGAFDRG